MRVARADCVRKLAARLLHMAQEREEAGARHKIHVVAGYVGELGEVPEHVGRVVRDASGITGREVIDRQLVAGPLKSDSLKQKRVPLQSGPHKRRIRGSSRRFQQADRCPDPFDGRDAAFPFRIGIIPRTVGPLPGDDVPRTIDGDVAIRLQAGPGEELPVRERPISLCLEIKEVVVPGLARDIALDEPADSVIEANAGIGAKQGAAIPMPGHQVFMQAERGGEIGVRARSAIGTDLLVQHTGVAGSLAVCTLDPAVVRRRCCWRGEPSMNRRYQSSTLSSAHSQAPHSSSPRSFRFINPST